MYVTVPPLMPHFQASESQRHCGTIMGHPGWLLGPMDRGEAVGEALPALASEAGLSGETWYGVELVHKCLIFSKTMPKSKVILIHVAGQTWAFVHA